MLNIRMTANIQIKYFALYGFFSNFALVRYEIVSRLNDFFSPIEMLRNIID